MTERGRGRGFAASVELDTQLPNKPTSFNLFTPPTAAGQGGCAYVAGEIAAGVANRLLGGQAKAMTGCDIQAATVSLAGLSVGGAPHREPFTAHVAAAAQGTANLAAGDGHRENRPGGGHARGMVGDAEGGAARRGPGFAPRMDVVPRTRPAYLVSKEGTSGRPLKLKANYVEILPSKVFRLCQHVVSFDPPIDHTGIRKSLIHEHRATIGNSWLAFDGSVFYTTQSIGNEETPLVLESTRKTDGSKVNVTIKFIKNLPSTDPQMFQVYGIVARKLVSHLGLEQVGQRGYHYDMDGTRTRKIPQHGVEIASGFVTGIRAHERSMLMNIHVHHKVMRTDTVLQHMNKIRATATGGNWLEALKSKIVGSIVITRYNNKTYRVDDIDCAKRPTSIWNEKTQETYADYYMRRYNIKIQILGQPLLVSRPKVKDRRSGVDGLVYLIPEVCFMTGLSEEMRSDYRVMRDVAQITSVNPETRTGSIRQLIGKIHQTPGCAEQLSNFNMEVGRDLVDVKGRQLPPLNLNVARTRNNTTQVVTRGSGDWQSDMRDIQFLRSAKLNQWVLLCTQRDSRAAENFAQTMEKAARTFGVTVKPPRIHTIANGTPSAYQQAISEVIGKWGTNLDMILAVLPDNKPDRYGLLKRMTYVDNAIPSQGVVAKTISNEKSLMSVASKIVQQMICKLGGALWHVGSMPPKAMICGFDVNHDTLDKKRSAGALVCSMDPFCTSYMSRVTFHTERNELSGNLASDMLIALKRFKERNNFAPEKIIFYRDGVGEGQTGQVIDVEVKALEETIKQHYPNTKLMVIVVSKRIHSQFYLQTARGDMDNPPAGTVIDNVVTNPELYDFFLIPQSVRQGTVNPVHYNIIHDTGVGLSPDSVQRLTFVLTHMYYNWSGTVRVPAPVQYAHKLAFLAGETLHRSPNAKLSERLFYL